IHALVGIAIAGVTLGEIEQWIQTPGSPNLYWPLTNLPTPFVDMRKPLQGDRLMVDNLFSDVRDLLKGSKDKAAAPRAEMFAYHLMKLREDFKLTQKEWQTRLEMATYVARTYPTARETLLKDLAWKQEDVDALPVTLAVLLVEVYNYDLMYDDVLKWY